MDAHLHTKINDVVEALKAELCRHTSCWSKIRTPSELFDFEQNLQAILNRLQTGLVGAVLEAIQRDKTLLPSANTKPGGSAGSSTRDGAMYGYSLWADNMPTSKPRMQGSRRMPIKEVEVRNDIDTAQVSIQYYDG